LPRHRAISRIALVCAAVLAAAAAGCANRAQVFENNNEGGWFSKPVDIFVKPDWAKVSGDSKTAELGPKGPVGPEDMVGADGSCAAPVAESAPVAAAAAQAAATEPAADRPVGSVAGDLAGAPRPAATQASAKAMPSAEPGAPPVLGGIALGMTECQTVQRAGQPGNVNISAGDKGDRKVVLTYLSGPWPGIYTFDSGRLKVVERTPEQAKPAKATTKKKPKKPAQPLAATTTRVQ
jgi:hypothetical protein